MTILKHFRKSNFSILVSVVVLFVSCSKYKIEEAPTFSKYTRILSDPEIIRIASEHNDNLTLLFSNKPASLDDVRARALQLYSTKGLTQNSLKLERYYIETGNDQPEKPRPRPAWVTADGISAGISFVTLALVASAVALIGAATGGAGIVATTEIIASLLGIGFESALNSLVIYIMTHP